MTDSDKPIEIPIKIPKRKKRKWLRRIGMFIFALVALLIVVAIMLKTAAIWGKPVAQRYIQSYTGLPTSIETMKVELTPTPKIYLENIQIGDATFGARINECLVQTNPLEPVMQKSFVALVELTGIQVNLPEKFDDIETVMLEYLEKFRGGSAKSNEVDARPETPSFDVHVDLDAITVYKGDILAAEGYLSLVNLMSATTQVSWSLDAPLLRPETRINGAIRVSRSAEGSGVSGNITLAEFHVNDLLQQLERTSPLVADLPDVAVNMTTIIEGDPNEQVSLTVDGDLSATDAEMFSGDFSGTLWYDAEKLTLNDFNWKSPDMEIDGDGNYNYTGHFAVQAPKARIAGDPLNVLLALAPTGAIRLSAGKGGYIDLSDLLVGVDENGNMRFSQGAIDFKHILAIPEGAKTGLGDFEGTVNIAENTINIQRVVGQGFSAAGTVQADVTTQSAVFALAAEVDLASLVKTSLGPSIPIQSLSGKLKLQELVGSYSLKDGLKDDMRMRMSLENVGGTYAIGQGSDPISLKGVSGSLQYQDGVLAVSEIKGAGLNLKGNVKPDLDTKQARVDLSGEMDLSGGLIRLFLPEAVTAMTGNLNIEKLAGTFASGGGLPSDLQVNAALNGGGVQINTGTYDESLKNVMARLETDGKNVTVNASAQGLRVGEVSLSGKHDLSKNVFTGKTQCSPNILLQPYLSGQPYPVLIASLLNVYSTGVFDVHLELPGDARKHLFVTLDRAISPKVKANVTLLPGKEGYKPGEISLQADCPLDSVDFRELAYPVTANNTATLNFSHQPATHTYTATVDLQQVKLDVAPHFQKAAGDDMRIEVKGKSEPAWGMSDIDLILLGERLRVDWSDAGLGAKQFSLNLAALARCFPTAQNLSGRIEGSIWTSPLDVNLTLQNVKAQFSTPLPISEADGVLRYNDQRIECKNLRVLGAKNNFMADAILQQGNVRAKITGESLDIDSFMGYYTTFAALQAGKNQEEPQRRTSTRDVAIGAPPAPSGNTSPTQGTANIDIKQVHYLGEVFRQVRADMFLSEKEVRMENLHVVPMSGSVSGTLKIGYPTTPSRRYLETDLTLNEADMRVIDKWYYLEPRGVYGTASGTVKMTVPYSDDGVVYNGLNGTANLLMKNGSFGKMGFATRMTTAMRSTEIFQLRAPQLKDKGLTFEASTLNLTATNGIIEIDPFDMKSPSYEIKATGVLNYPEDSSNIVASFNALERVTGITQNIPLLGEAINTIRGVTDLTIYISGSPNNPQYRIGSRVIEGPQQSEPESGRLQPGDRIRERATNLFERIGL